MKIGITVAKSKTQVFLNQAYVDYVVKSGFDPVLINDYNDLEAMSEFCDGLLLPGGIDLEPTFYGEDNLASTSCDPERDDFERQAFQSFLMRGKRVFGICRGFQLIVREFIAKNGIPNAKFYQHINEHSLSNSRSAKRSTPTHSVYCNRQALYNEKEYADMFVNSMHHQALMAIKPIYCTFKNGDSIKEVATSNFGLKSKSKEHIVEGVAVTMDGSTVLGVQWHPEELLDTALLHTFFTNKDNGVNNEKGHVA